MQEKNIPEPVKKEKKKRNPGLNQKKIEAAISSAKKNKKTIKLSDGGGLILMVQPSGNACWHFVYSKPDGTRIDPRTGSATTKYRQHTIKIGFFREIPLGSQDGRRDPDNMKTARAFQREYANLLSQDIDPKEYLENKKAETERERLFSDVTFRKLAEKYFQLRLEGKIGKKPISQAYKTATGYVIANHLSSILDKNIRTITDSDILKIKENTLDKPPTCHRAIEICKQVFRYAKKIKCGNEPLISHNPTDCIENEDLPGFEPEHHQHPESPEQIGKLLSLIEADDKCNEVTKSALLLLPILFCRPSEMLQMKWSDLEGIHAENEQTTAKWSYSVSKTGVEHEIPLPPKAIDLIKKLIPFTGDKEYVFYSSNSGSTLSKPGLNRALKRYWKACGFKLKSESKRLKDISPHGFRRMAKTFLMERGIAPALSDSQMAHKPQGQVNQAYDGSTLFDARVELLQYWSELLDRWKNVIFEGKQAEIELKENYSILKFFKWSESR